MVAASCCSLCLCHHALANYVRSLGIFVVFPCFFGYSHISCDVFGRVLYFVLGSLKVDTWLLSTKCMGLEMGGKLPP